MQFSDNPLYNIFAQRAIYMIGSGGADFGECDTTLERIGSQSFDVWHEEWVKTSKRVEEIGDSSLKRGHKVSAREAYLRASMYYHISYFPLYGKPTDPRVLETYNREARVFQKAGALFHPSLEVLEIPFEGGSLPGYFIKIDDKPRPTIVQTNGYDCTIHEMYFSHGPASRRRGYNYLIFDGPGQGRNLYRDNLHMRPNWETVVGPVLDYALTLNEVDPDNLILAGWSFGGYFSVRAACFESHRLKAVVADPGQWDQRENIMAFLPLSDEQKAAFPDIDPTLLQPMEDKVKQAKGTHLYWEFIQRGFWVNDADSLYEYLKKLAEYEVSPYIHQLKCATAVTQSEGDTTALNAQKLIDAIPVTNKKRIYFSTAEGSGGHCEAMARSLYHQKIFDWLDEVIHNGH